TLYHPRNIGESRCELNVHDTLIGNLPKRDAGNLLSNHLTQVCQRFAVVLLAKRNRISACIFGELVKVIAINSTATGIKDTAELIKTLFVAWLNDDAVTFHPCHGCHLAVERIDDSFGFGCTQILWSARAFIGCRYNDRNKISSGSEELA